MRKIVLLISLAVFTQISFAQLGNGWIDYTKTYYKFKLAKNGVCRISQTALAGIGLGNTPAEQFQLWRNGQQVRIFTSRPTGAFTATDYIEFWGQMNDGIPDKQLYIKPGYQLCDSFSLFTDTVAYFLTVNPNIAANLRYTTAANTIAGNTLPAEPYFMRTVANPYKNRVNGGYAVRVGEFVYSSSYEMGEGWTSFDAAPGFDLYKEFTGLNVYTSAPPNSVSFYIAAFGNALNTRNFRVKFFNNTILDVPMNFFDTVKMRLNNLPLTLLQNPDYLQVAMNGNSSVPTDRVVVANLELTYPARFNFNNEKSFFFNLPATDDGNYLEIDNFNYGSTAPVLYSISDGKRYTGDISVAGKVRFVLPPSAIPTRQFLLVNQEGTNTTAINTFQSRNFVNYNLPANQGDYLIVTHNSLLNDGQGNNYIDQYKQYRASAAGGSYTPVIFNIEELTDQFAWGIKGHPASVRDLVRFAYNNFPTRPKFIFLIGRGVSAYEARSYENDPAMAQIDLVPTFGWPASDVLLVAEPGSTVPLIPVGRLAAITGAEIKSYLGKVKEYEATHTDPLQTIANKAWMKNIIHVIGGADSIETAQFRGYMDLYKHIYEDSLLGARVETFEKASTSSVEQANGERIEQLVNEGVGMIGYFGHSSANTLAFNLSSPEVYTNAGKYPFFNISGCSAGNFFTFDPTRVNNNLSISEKYVLADRRGSIAFLASTHLGIPPFLHFYNIELAKNYSRVHYGDALGNIIKQGLETLGGNPSTLNYYTRIHLEEINLHGDPAIKLNYFNGPDYTVEEPNVKISPSLLSVADNNFTLKVTTYNIGKAVNDSMRLYITRRLANDTVQVLYNQRIKATLFSDSVTLVVPINPITDKGRNRITVTVDADNAIQELSETNNSVTKEFFIFEDEIRPISPYNYSIVNNPAITFSASTANPLVQRRDFVMEIDTTELFNSPFKKTYNTSGNGGLVQFTPNNITYRDSTVYYWRTSMVPVNNNPVIWNGFSFIYLPGSSSGYNQSHYFQHTRSTYSNSIRLDNDRVFRYGDISRNLVIRTGLYPATDYDRIDVTFDYDMFELYGCKYNSLQFLVYDTLTMQPWKNRTVNGSGRFNSWPVCGSSFGNSFEFPYTDAMWRKRAMDFIDSIPDGMYISITNLGDANTNNTFIADWMADENLYGTGNTLYHKLKALGFDKLDSFTHNIPFIFLARKNNNSFDKQQMVGVDRFAQLTGDFLVNQRNNNGTIESPVFGPARSWTSLHWMGRSIDADLTDKTSFQIIGVKADGTQTVLRTIVQAQDTTLNFVNPIDYPYLKIKMQNNDLVNATPNQLKFWRINADLVPEGAVAPSLVYSFRDSVEQGDIINVEAAFKNISAIAFDSLKVKMVITDRNNIPHTLVLPHQKPLAPNDTLRVKIPIDTRLYPGLNSMYLAFNPDDDQPEQALFNNFIFNNFTVKEDLFNPLLDVTFDGVHILNRDIVAAKPHVIVELKDESRFMALADTALLKVMVRFPDGSLHNYFFGDTMRFTPANLSSGENNAQIDLTPYFPEDGEYELIVSGKDVVGNKAGNLEYRVVFTVINTPMISNLLNYPNPFTTSTAFVFTITGSEVPQQLRIQILTITGKVVREINREELGDLHVGRNITEFKWDGTDMYGQPLANGVYLYRVITSHNGKALDKYRAEGEKTDQYFKAGYGKMYLMR